MTQSSAHLAQRGILVTRPADQAGPLLQWIDRAGGQAIAFPTIGIQAIDHPQCSADIRARLEGYDGAIFISANAVRHGLPHLRPWPVRLNSFAIGDATARALKEGGVLSVHTPVDGADSEALLRLDALQHPQAGRILIVRGEGGRELLAQTLRARDVHVDYLECYRRTLPKADPGPVLSLFAEKRIHAVIIHSTQGMQNLFTLLGEPGYACLCATPTFVPHPRIVEQARGRGIKTVIVTGTGDGEIVRALEDHFAETST